MLIYVLASGYGFIAEYVSFRMPFVNLSRDMLVAVVVFAVVAAAVALAAVGVAV